MASEIKDVVEKLSSYNIFTTLLPGAVFAALADRFTDHQLVQPDVITAVAFYYFLGMILSRIGALIVAPIAKMCGLVTFKPYNEYLTAYNRDELIPHLVETGNMYRTMIAVALSLGALLLYDKAREELTPRPEAHILAMLVGMAALFAAAYARNTKFITRRIEHATSTLSRHSESGHTPRITP